MNYCLDPFSVIACLFLSLTLLYGLKRNPKKLFSASHSEVTFFSTIYNNLTYSSQ